MVGLALEYDLNTADADDGRHQADVDALGLEHHALLDMHFEEGGDILSLRLREFFRIAADAAKRGRQRLAVRALQREHVRFERAGHAAAADTRETIFARLLSKKVHHFEWMTQHDARIFQRARSLERGDDASNPVEAAARRNRVRVRAEHNGLQPGFNASAPADEIARRIDSDFKPGLVKSMR